MNNSAFEQIVLFIGNEAATPVAPFLPDGVGLQVAATIAQAGKYLRQAGSGAPPVALLLLGADQDAVSLCRVLQAEPQTAVYPVIPILRQAEQRAAVLQAGAADYLLAPLRETEVIARLSPWLRRPDIFCMELLGQTLGDTAGGLPFERALKERLTELGAFFGAAAVLLPRGDKSAPPPHSLRYPLPGRHKWELLQLTFPRPPRLTPIDRHVLTRLSDLLGRLLEMGQAQEELAVHAQQSALLTLAARLLGRQLDMPQTLDLALEQTAALLNAAGGSIWLLSADGQWLEAAVTLSRHPPGREPFRIPAGAELLLWATQQGQGVALDMRKNRLPFAVMRGAARPEDGRYLLIAPLRRQTLPGFILLQTDRQPYRKQDVLLLEEITPLIAAAIANVAQMRALRAYGKKQRILRRMSVHLTNSLEMDNVLSRSVSWAARLCPAEYSLLWLVEDSQNSLRLAAYTGLEPPPDTVMLEIGQGFIGQSAADARLRFSAASDSPLPDSDKKWLQAHLHIAARSILSVPVVYQDLAIGALVLINRIGGDFTWADAELLSTASRIIAGAIGNATLYAQVLALTDERERERQRAIQTARLAVVGRLTASLSHEINNPMQAIKGALSLALEEIDDPAALREYLALGIEQAERVARLVSRMRRVYRPDNDAPEPVAVGAILRETMAVSRKELQRHKIRLRLALSPQTPLVWASASQLHLAFLNITLTMCDVIGQSGGGALLVRSGADEQYVWVEFVTAVAAAAIASLRKMLDDDTPQETGFGLSLCRDIIAAHGGRLYLPESEQLVFRIEIPFL